MSRTARMTDAEQAAAVEQALANFARHRARSRAALPRVLADVREAWSERAAIREYLGGMRHRRNAELHAVGDTFDMFIHPVGG